MTATLITAAFVLAPEGQSGKNPALGGVGPASFDSRCAAAYQGVRFYRTKYDEYRRELGLSLAPRVEQAMNCQRLRERYRYWRTAAKINRVAAQNDQRTLHSTRTWRGAVEEVQRAFPGTASWLMSCSGAEGGHGRWVRYGGGAYYPGYEYTDAVGNWLQYRWSTFKGHYRHGLDSLRSRGFRFHLPPPTDVRAWLLPIGAAIAGGWARWSGNDDSHWSASWGNGC